MILWKAEFANNKKTWPQSHFGTFPYGVDHCFRGLNLPTTVKFLPCATVVGRSRDHCRTAKRLLFVVSVNMEFGSNSRKSLSSGSSVVVPTCDSESGCPGSSPEWGLICFEASITAQGLPEPSSLRGSTLGTSAAEHEGCNWGMQID